MTLPWNSYSLAIGQSLTVKANWKMATCSYAAMPCPHLKRMQTLLWKVGKSRAKSDQLVSVLQHGEKRKFSFFFFTISYFVLGALVGMIKRLLREMKKYIFQDRNSLKFAQSKDYTSNIVCQNWDSNCIWTRCEGLQLSSHHKIFTSIPFAELNLGPELTVHP